MIRFYFYLLNERVARVMNVEIVIIPNYEKLSKTTIW